MFILKFFASIFLVFFGLGLLFIIISFIIARNFISDLNDSIKDNLGENSPKKPTFNDENNIPSAIECPICGTFYAQMPENNLCSCGAKLTK